MNKTISYVIGGAIGGTIGYFIGSVIVELIIIKSQQEGGYDDTEEMPQGDELVGPLKMDPNQPVKNYTRYFTAIERPDLADLAQKYNSPIENRPTMELREMTDKEDEEFDLEGLEVEDLIDEGADNQPISIISMEEYANTEGYTAYTLNYYDDDVVTDEEDRPLDRPERILGDDALVSFGELSGDEDVVYVRNIPRKALYEIRRTNKIYAGVPVRQARRRPLSPRLKELKDEETGKS
jgi:hypothetical protein